MEQMPDNKPGKPGAKPEVEPGSMKQSATNAFRTYFEPVFRRPEFVQTAALCLRQGAKGPEVLLVSSLSTKRWIIPKGWPMEGRTLAQAALQEAWEEAGVTGRVDEDAIGAFSYRKLVKGGIPVTCRCDVFRVQVDTVTDRFPEEGRRKRQWVAPQKAAKLVEEPELKELLRSL
jgi:8-oxo-dGTP pyrophosphatase MutT (NUDIX family)